MLSLDAITRRSTLIEQRTYQRAQRLGDLRTAVLEGTATPEQVAAALTDLAQELQDLSSVQLMTALLVEQHLQDLEARVAALERL